MAERDLVGYGGHPPHPRWPGAARIAVQFVLNIEEGAESNILDGDARSEAWLHELPGRPPRTGERDPSVEGMYEYGSRAGVWRILELFEARGLPLTAFAVGLALERNPRIARALRTAGHEVAGHGYRWLDYREVPADEEREHIRRTIETIAGLCGKRPVGWYTGRVSHNTRRLLREEGGFLYDSDAYNDDLPYWLAGSPPASCDPLHPGQQRRPVFIPERSCLGRRLLPSLARCLRHPVAGRRALPQDDEHRVAWSHQWSSRPDAGTGAVSRLCAGPRPDLDLPARRDRPPLAGRAPGLVRMLLEYR